MLQPTISAADKPVFRELNGDEFALIASNHIAEQVRKVVYEGLKRSGNCDVHNAYPVAVVHFVENGMRVKCLPGEADPKAFLVRGDIETGDVRVDEGNEAVALMDEVIPLAPIEAGTSVATAPDKLREENNIPVLQPVKEPNGRVRNRAVNAPVKGK